MKIQLDDLTGKEIAELLQIHLAEARKTAPPESVHALPLEALRSPKITVWSVWEERELLGCGALKEIDANHGEVKSMHTAKHHRRKGVAAHLLKYIIQQAKQRGYHRLSLETGAMTAFVSARALYQRYGFEYCDPFDKYVDDPNSVFMTRRL